MAKISRIWAREILDSRSIPTIEVACKLDNGYIAVSSVPSGTSVGTYEALELRDNDQQRYKGKGVLKAVGHINQIIGPGVVGLDPIDQEFLDKKIIGMDGTENKSKLGANAILAVSVVAAKAGAVASQLDLFKWIQKLAKRKGIDSTLKIPPPVSVVIEGGLHGAGNLDFQEFFIIPASSKRYSEGLRMIVEIYLSLGENLKRRGAIHSTGEEGAYAPNLFTNADALEILVESIRQTQYDLGRDLFLGLDVAANTLFAGGEYTIRDRSSPLDDNQMLEYYKSLNQQYKFSILEDPFYEDAWEAWKKITTAIGDQVTIVGDDLLVTNPKKVDKAIAEAACNAILVKPNQIGSVSETLEVIRKSKDAGWKVIVSHRGGETNDSFIADFAVGVGADFVKFGAPARGERVAKYNRLLAIEAQIMPSQSSQ